MAAPWNPPVKNEDFEFVLTLTSSTTGRIVSNPTIASGDFKISKDEGAFANLTTLPSVAPASGVQVKVALSATEMNADKILVVWADQTDPTEWQDGSICILTTAS